VRAGYHDGVACVDGAGLQLPCIRMRFARKELPAVIDGRQERRNVQERGSAPKSESTSRESRSAYMPLRIG
jgi:hypothetical protein